ncbi:MAG: S1 RNA-binding domain-containing protein [Candidatus Berkelbacteria bacterium]
MSKEPQSMKDLVADYANKLVPFKQGDVVEVKVMEISKTRVLVDVAGFCLGYIPEKEMSPEMASMKPGDKILAYVLVLENADGYCILSLKRADKERVTKILEEKFTSGGVLPVKCHEANRGGLLCAFGEYEGFLPVSQLASSHYPKVSSGDKEEILGKLRQLLNQTFQVKIISFEPNAGKLIFSEKAAGDVVQQEKIRNYQIGDILDGEITGIVDFGLFINMGEVEGLVHISEVAWEHVENLRDMFKVGQKVKVQVISTENNRLSLSIKRLIEDPWVGSVTKYKNGDKVKGKITRITPFGAFVSFDGLDGLVHISEMGEKDASKVVEVGSEYDFYIVSIEPELHKLNLSMNNPNGKSEKKAVVAEAENESEEKSEKKATKTKAKAKKK